MYLQQLGRGLRLHPDKGQLARLDFIARQRPEFRFSERFRALSSRRDIRIDRQVEEGFAWLPAGCLVRLSRLARDRVLANIRQQLDIQSAHLRATLRALMTELRRRPNLDEILEHLAWDDPDTLLQKGLPSALLGLDAAQPQDVADTRGLQRGLRQLLECDDPELLTELSELLQSPVGAPPCDLLQAALALSLLWGQRRPGLQVVIDALRTTEPWREDVLDVIRWRSARVHLGPARRFPHLTGSQRLHSRYTREQILFALGH